VSLYFLDMKDSETYGIEKGHEQEVIAWLNEQSTDKKFEARLYGYSVITQNFGEFEMFSWIGDVKTARKLIIKASKRFKIKIIEGGYKPTERIYQIKKFDFAKVRKGDRTIGQLEFEMSRFGNHQWEIKNEERH
jgi:hypothetical protein